MTQPTDHRNAGRNLRVLVTSTLITMTLLSGNAAAAADPPRPAAPPTLPAVPHPTAADDELRRKLEGALDRLDRQDAEMKRQADDLAAMRARLDEGEQQAKADAEAAAEAATKKPPAATTSIGIGNGFQVKVGDAFSLQLRARMQLRFETLIPSADAIAAGAPKAPEMGFMVRRLRLVLAGNAFTPKLTYYIQLGLSNQDTESDLRLIPRDAYLNYAPLRELQLRAGQMKVPFGKQRVVSSSALQLVDRSIVTAELNLDRDVGVYLWSPDVGGKGVFQYFAGIFGGEGRNRLPAPAGLLYAARVQFTPLGLFDDLVESDVERRATPKLSIGLSGAYNQDTNRQRSTLGSTYTLGTFNYAHAGADLMFKVRGFSLQSEFFLRLADKDQLEDTAAKKVEHSRSALGYYVQAGYLWNDHIELAGRWGEYYPIGATDPKLVRSHEAGGGLSYYFYKHNLKIQADYFYLYSDAPSSERHQVRLQAQLFL